MPRALQARRIARLVVTLTLAPLIAPSGALGQNLQCPATAPPGPELANTLFTNLIGTLNYAYANKVGKIDPLAPGDDPPFGTGTQLVDCGSWKLSYGRSGAVRKGGSPVWARRPPSTTSSAPVMKED